MITWNYEVPEESIREPLPAGEYLAVLRKAESGIATGKNAGATKLDLVFRVAEKATIRTSLVFCESLAWKVNQFIQAAGLSVGSGVMELDETSLVGLRCIVVLDIEDYTKKDQTAGRANRINGFKAVHKNIENNQKQENEIPF